MKKTILLLMIGLTTLLLVSCKKKPVPVEFDFNKDLDTENIFFDDFDNGISKDNWVIGNQKWGIGNGGVIKENVSYTSDGVVVLQANGDYYDGDHVGINANHGKRTGAMIKTREAFGPGRYETRLKVMPRFGSTTALWTFYYDGSKNLNQEIDIELNIENDFHYMMTTNWISEQQYSTKSNLTDTVLNDFEWHTFRFDWRTNPSRIDYFLDDVLISTQESYVPDHAGEFNIGNWFPDAWAGVPNFETDYTYVDWFKYTPFKNNEYIQTPSNEASPDYFYPSEPSEYPVANLVSNASFEGLEDAWRFDALGEVEITDGVGINNSKAIKIPEKEYAYQMITGLDETFEMRLKAKVKHDILDKGYIMLEYFPNEINKLGDKIIEINSTNSKFVNNEYYEIEVVFDLPKDVKRAELSLNSDKGNIYFDDLFFNLSKKPHKITTEDIEKQEYHFEENFTNGISMDKWNISNRVWGGTHHGGVVHQNVNYTSDGLLVLQANGDYYDGDIQGINKSDGKRTGAAIYTKEYFGPGEFEIVAKAMPRFGATTAFWTYNFENGINSEIDIELNVNNDFHTAWFTNYLTESNSVHQKMDTPVLNNDGDFHTYKIEWHTAPTPMIKYYIDGVLYHTATTKIPTLEAQFWIGVWFPNKWAGEPNFETDYLIVDSFTYKKYDNQPYDRTNNLPGSTSSFFYPTSPIELPKNNFISNGDLKTNLGYELSNAQIIDKTLYINTTTGYAKQYITGINEKLKMKLEFEVKGSSSNIEIVYYDANKQIIDSTFYNIDVQSQLFTKSMEILNYPTNTRSIDIIFKGENIEYRNLYLNLQEG